MADTDIKLIRGDSESFLVSMKEKGEAVPFEDGDIVYFTVKKNYKDTDIILQKVVTAFEDGKAMVDIQPADTNMLDFTVYVYDVQLTKADGWVKTIIPPSAFEICPEVTYD